MKWNFLHKRKPKTQSLNNKKSANEKTEELFLLPSLLPFSAPGHYLILYTTVTSSPISASPWLIGVGDVR